MNIETESLKRYVVNFSGSDSDPERVYTLLEGLKLWLQHPFLGIGLGGFVHLEQLSNSRFLIIHNTVVWLLAEFGLFGASIFLFYATTIIKTLSNKIKAAYKKKITLSYEDRVLLVLIVVFGCMSIAHEMLYQRIFWFLFGVLITKHQRKQKIDHIG